MEFVEQSVRASSVAELFWSDPDGAPDGRGVIALSWGGTPAVAFTYALEPQARAVASAPQVVLTLTETRSTGSTFAPVALTGRPRLAEDLAGSVFAEELLDEELRRYPPARKFADSALLRREHWWYLPRLIVTVDVTSARPVAPRASADDHVLCVATPEGLDVQVVRPRARPGDDPRTLVLSPSGDQSALPGGRAALVGQDASFPDLERWASWCCRGTCDGTTMRLTQPPPPVGLPPTPSLWQRLREQRAFARACREGISRAERAR